MTLSIFSCIGWPSVCLLLKNGYSGPLPILKSDCVFLLLSCMSSLYILDVNPLSDIWLANIFSHSIGCLFILLGVSFAVQKLFGFMESHLFIFAFVACAFSVISKKNNCQDLCQRDFPLCFLLGILKTYI